MENDKCKQPTQAKAFLASLRQADSLNIASARGLLEVFCHHCWSLEDLQEETFNVLSAKFKTMSPKETMEMIPLLIEKSQIYPRLVFLAYDMFKSLSFISQNCLEIPMIYWTMDENTSISQDEYCWRMKNFLPCWKNGNGTYSRPLVALDLMCYDKVIRMIMESGSKTLIYTSDWK